MKIRFTWPGAGKWLLARVPPQMRLQMRRFGVDFLAICIIAGKDLLLLLGLAAGRILGPSVRGFDAARLQKKRPGTRRFDWSVTGQSVGAFHHLGLLIGSYRIVTFRSIRIRRKRNVGARERIGVHVHRFRLIHQRTVVIRVVSCVGFQFVPMERFVIQRKHRVRKDSAGWGRFLLTECSRHGVQILVVVDKLAARCLYRGGRRRPERSAVGRVLHLRTRLQQRIALQRMLFQQIVQQIGRIEQVVQVVVVRCL